MNNSFLEPEIEVSSGNKDGRLQEREQHLRKLIEALAALQGMGEWSTLREELFDGAVEKLERELAAEAKKPDLSLPELYRLQGKLDWASRHMRLERLIDTYRAELAGIRKKS